MQAWRAALGADGQTRDGAQGAELTAWMPSPMRATRPGPKDWPDGMRVIARRELPQPGAQLHLTDHDGWRIICFATNTSGPGWTLAALEVRHRPRARANQIWLEIVALAADLLAWTVTAGVRAKGLAALPLGRGHASGRRSGGVAVVASAGLEFGE